MTQTLSPLQAKIQALIADPKFGLQYAVIQELPAFQSLAEIYRAGLKCTELGIRYLRLNERLLAQHYGKMADCFFTLFELLYK